MARKEILLITFLTLLLIQTRTTESSQTIATIALPEKLKGPLLMVIVNSSIYTAIMSSLDQYVIDVESSGFSVNITETDKLPDKSPKGIRMYLQGTLNQGLIGAFLVGDIPEVWYEVDGKKFPTDMYYRDLNGFWIDPNGDGTYDQHIGDVSPEIWVGRLKASKILGDEASVINNYFTKNHRYRSGLRVLPWWRSLVYIDDDGINWTEDAELSLSQISTDLTLVTDPAATNATDYKNRLKDPFGYQWLYLMSHGSFDFHSFKVRPTQDLSGWGVGPQTVYPWEYRAIDPRIFFYLFFVCSAARYTEPEYLLGSVVFTNTYSLLAIGSTDLIFSISFREFFTSLSEGKTIGDAFQKWFLEHSNDLKKQDYETMFYGLTVIGDPTLQSGRPRSVQLHDVSVDDVRVSLGNANEKSVSITATIENRGNFTETFEFTIQAGALTLMAKRLSLRAKAITVIAFNLTQPYRVILTDYPITMIKVMTDVLPEEFNLADNVKQVYIKGVIILDIPDYSPYAMLFLAIFTVVCFNFLKMLGSERPLLLRYLARAWNYSAKKIAGANRH